MTDRAGRAVAQWAVERPDLETSTMAVIGRLMEAADRITRDHQAPLYKTFGIQVGEFDVLMTLRRAGAPYVLTPTQLYEATMITSGAMTARLDRLEKAGWVARQPDPEDRRGTRVGLTLKGADLIDQMIEAHLQNQRTILAGLDKGEQDQLSALLAKLIATFPNPYKDRS